MNDKKMNIIPYFFRVGEFVESKKAFALPLFGTNGLYFQKTKTNNSNLINIIQRLTLSLCAELDKSLIDFYVIDIGIKINYPYLRDLSQEIKNVNYITEKNKLNEFVNFIIDKAHQISLNYLSKDTPSLIEYNKQNEKKEKYRFIIINDNKSIDVIANDKQSEFINVLKEAEKLGFYFIFTEWDKENNQNQRNKNFSTDINPGTSITIHNNIFILNKDVNQLNKLQNQYKVVIDNLTDKELKEIYNKIIENNAAINSSEVDDVVVPIGTHGSRVINFSIGPQSSCYHTFISGQIGMGKSNILNTIILQIGRRYKPNEIELFLIDFKGTEFGIFDKHPNVRMLQTDTNLTKTYYILSKIRAEGENRKKILEKKAKDIQEYNKKNPEKQIPIILLIVDEFQSVYDLTERSTNKDLNNLFKEIARTYRSCGIYFILSTQKINDEKIDQDIISQTQVRIFTATTDFVGNKLLDSRNNFDLKKLERGQALYNNKNGLKEGNNFVNIYYAGNIDEINKKLDDISIKNPRQFELHDIDKIISEN